MFYLESYKRRFPVYLSKFVEATGFFPKMLSDGFKSENKDPKGIENEKKIVSILVDKIAHHAKKDVKEIYKQARFRLSWPVMAIGFPNIEYDKNYKLLEKDKDLRSYVINVQGTDNDTGVEMRNPNAEAETADDLEFGQEDEENTPQPVQTQQQQNQPDKNEDVKKELQQKLDDNNEVLQMAGHVSDAAKNQLKDHPTHDTTLGSIYNVYNNDLDDNLKKNKKEVNGQIPSDLQVKSNEIKRLWGVFGGNQGVADSVVKLLIYAPKPDKIQNKNNWIEETVNKLKSTKEEITAKLKNLGVEVKSEVPQFLAVTLDLLGSKQSSWWNDHETHIDAKKLGNKLQPLEAYLDKILPKSAYKMHKKDDEFLNTAINVFSIDDLDGKDYHFKLLPTEAVDVGWFGNKKLLSRLNLNQIFKRSDLIKKAAFILTPKVIFDKWFTNGKLFVTTGAESKFHTFGAYVNKPQEVVNTISQITGQKIDFNINNIKAKSVGTAGH